MASRSGEVVVVIERAEREESMKAVIADVLLSGDFNPLNIDVTRPRRPILDPDGVELYWADTGVVVVTFTGLMPVDPLWSKEVNDEDVDVEGLEFDDDDDGPLGTCSMLSDLHVFDEDCVGWQMILDTVEERDGERASP